MLLLVTALKHVFAFSTGKSFSEALILALVNPQYDARLFMELQVQYKKNTWSEHVVYKNCFLFLFWHSNQFLYTTCSELVFFLYWSCNSMNNLSSNLSSYCGLTDSRMRASETDLPVHTYIFLYQRNVVKTKNLTNVTWQTYSRKPGQKEKKSWRWFANLGDDCYCPQMS